MYSVNQIIWFSTEYQIMILGYKPNINYLPNIIWLNRIFSYSAATLISVQYLDSGTSKTPLNKLGTSLYDKYKLNLLEIKRLVYEYVGIIIVQEYSGRGNVLT